MKDRRFIEVNEIPQLLMEKIEGFVESEEYLGLDEEFRTSPGLICARCSSYINRIYREAGATDVIDNAFRIVELLSTVRDIEVQNIVVTEILEMIDFHKHPELFQRLGPRSKALYDRWLWWFDPIPGRDRGTDRRHR